VILRRQNAAVIAAAKQLCGVEWPVGTVQHRSRQQKNISSIIANDTVRLLRLRDLPAHCGRDANIALQPLGD